MNSAENINNSRGENGSLPRYLSKYVSKRTQKRNEEIQAEIAAKERKIPSEERKEKAKRIKESLR